MITKFKIFESGIYKYGIIDAYYNYYKNIEYLLCIDNRIGELEDTYDFTIGRKYKIKRNSPYIISIVDDRDIEQFFNSNSLFKNFSTDSTYDDYLVNRDAKKYNL